MERHNAPPTKRKIKKELLPANEPNIRKPSAQKESEETNGPLSSKDYSCISAETVSVIAESIGISHLGDDIASNLAEDVSYKLLEVINVSCTLMRKSKRRKLLTSDVNSAFRISDIHHIFGHSRKDPFKFLRLSDGDLFIPADNEVDLLSVVFSPNFPKIKKPSYITTSYPVLQSILVPPLNGHSIKTEGKPYFAVPHPKSTLNGDIKFAATEGACQSSDKAHMFQVCNQNTMPLEPNNKKSSSINNGSYNKRCLDGSIKENGHVKFAQNFGVREKLKRDSEEELKFSKAQLSFFKVIAKSIIEGHDHLFQQALASLRHSRKVDILSAPLLNFVALTVCHVPRHFGLIARLLELVEVLLNNVNINPTFSIAVNRLVNALLAVTADQNVLEGKNDFFLRRKAAQLLAKVLLVWGIEEQHVSELLARVARVLGDSKEKIQSHYGALVIFQCLGKAALSWLPPLLRCFIPFLEKRYCVTSIETAIQVEEIRGVLLDIAQLLSSDSNFNRFKIKSLTIQELQAIIQLDSLLYLYCGDAVCARRCHSMIKFQNTKRRDGHSGARFSPQSDLRSKQPTSNRTNLRNFSHFSQKQKKVHNISVVFENVCHLPTARRRDIHFRFAGANPVPKDGLRKKVLDKTHLQYKFQQNSEKNSTFLMQHLVVGRLHCSRPEGLRKNRHTYNLFNVL